MIICTCEIVHYSQIVSLDLLYQAILASIVTPDFLLFSIVSLLACDLERVSPENRVSGTDICKLEGCDRHPFRISTIWRACDRRPGCIFSALLTRKCLRYIQDRLETQQKVYRWTIRESHAVVEAQQILLNGRAFRTCTRLRWKFSRDCGSTSPAEAQVSLKDLRRGVY